MASNKAPIKLSSLKAKPTLVEKLLKDEDIIAEFGAPIQFWSWDRLPIETYMSLVAAESSDVSMRFQIAKTLILNEDGSPMLSGDEVFTPGVMTAVVSEVFKSLGNLSAGTSTGTTQE